MAMPLRVRAYHRVGWWVVVVVAVVVKRQAAEHGNEEQEEGAECTEGMSEGGQALLMSTLKHVHGAFMKPPQRRLPTAVTVSTVSRCS